MSKAVKVGDRVHHRYAGITSGPYVVLELYETRGKALVERRGEKLRTRIQRLERVR